MTPWISPRSCIPSGTSDTMSVLHLARASAVTFRESAEDLPNMSISQTVVRAREQLHAANFTRLPRHFSFLLSLLLLLSAFLQSFFYPLLLTFLHPPHHLSRIRWDSLWSFSLLSQERETRDCVRVTVYRSTAEVLWGPGPVIGLKCCPSAECLCVCLSNPRKDPLRSRKFI